MNNETWIKLYRKTLENGIMADHKAWAAFSWILLSVGKNTGKMTFGRYQMSDELKIKPNTLYLALHRLQKKYGVIKLINQKVYTEVLVVNWGKYQQSEKGQSNDNQIAIKRQPVENNTKQEVENRELRNIDIIADKQQSPVTEKTWVRKPLEKQTKLQRICYSLEDTLHTSIVNWGKQAKALLMMERAGYTEKQIIFVIGQMANDDFFQDKGFDLMTVANNIDKYKAKARKDAYVPKIN